MGPVLATIVSRISNYRGIVHLFLNGIWINIQRGYLCNRSIHLIFKYTFCLIVILKGRLYNRDMVPEETIRELCMKALRSQGPEFEMQLLDLYTQLKEHFDTPDCAQPMAQLVQNALHRPPDA